MLINGNLFREIIQKVSSINVQIFLRIKERCFAYVRNKILPLQKCEIIVHLSLKALAFCFSGMWFSLLPWKSRDLGETSHFVGSVKELQHPSSLAQTFPSQIPATQAQNHECTARLARCYVQAG